MRTKVSSRSNSCINHKVTVLEASRSAFWADLAPGLGQADRDKTSHRSL